MVRKSATGIANGITEPEGAGNGTANPNDGNSGESSESDSTIIGSDNGAINPGDIISGEPDGSPSGEPKRKRGRPAGSRNKAAGTSTRKETQADLAAAIFGVHLMLSKLIQIQELELDEDESQKLARAVERVNSLYSNFVVPEKVLAWIGLLTVLGAVYGPRIATYNLRKSEEKRKSPKVVDVTPISVGPAPPNFNRSV